MERERWRENSERKKERKAMELARIVACPLGPPILCCLFPISALFPPLLLFLLLFDTDLGKHMTRISTLEALFVRAHCERAAQRSAEPLLFEMPILR